MSSITVPECDGRCCAVFPLSIDIVQFVTHPEKFKDHDFVLDMLVSLSPETARKRWRDLGFGEFRGGPNHGDQLFTCRHWDEVTHRCTAYEDRPDLCRAYPYGRECEWCGSKGDVPAEATP
jgi:Fe-S-cluster containining protein